MFWVEKVSDGENILIKELYFSFRFFKDNFFDKKVNFRNIGLEAELEA